MDTEKRYLTSDYLAENPSWDSEDSPWKAKKVADILRSNNLSPSSICEVGCGAGGVLASLRANFPDIRLVGFDIAPDASCFWTKHAHAKIDFHGKDFLEFNQEHYQLILVLDVIEHVSDPSEFLARLRNHADYFVFHVPLDLSAVSVLREEPLLHVRRKVGHIHYYTKGLILTLLQECNYKILDWCYTGVAITGPRRSWKTKLALLPRLLAYAMNKNVGVRLLGGETLMVLAKPGAK